MRREATSFGAQNFVERTAGGLGPLSLSGLLAFGNTVDGVLGVRLVGPVAGLFVLAGHVVFRFYDVPDEVPAAGGGNAAT